MAVLAIETGKNKRADPRGNSTQEIATTAGSCVVLGYHGRLVGDVGSG